MCSKLSSVVANSVFRPIHFLGRHAFTRQETAALETAQRVPRYFLVLSGAIHWGTGMAAFEQLELVPSLH